MINIGLHHFRLVTAITQEGTLTKAAENLHLTQSALSHQLKELESELETIIFNRKGKKLELSKEGARFLSSAEKILGELRALEQDIKGFKEGKRGTLRISTQCYTAYHWLPRIIKYYKQVSPEIDIHINSAATYRPLDFLLSGELDVAIVRSKLDRPEIHYEPIFEDQLFTIMSSQHPLAKKKKICINDFQDQELFLPFNDPQSGNIPVVENLMAQQQVKPKHVHRIHYTDAIIEMVSSDLGVGIMANWIIKPYLESRDIVARPLPPEVSNRKWFAASCKKDLAIRHFIECLKVHFSEMTT